MKPCRDCGAPTSPAARSCPKCGILNPVVQWVALPDGAHETYREPIATGYQSPVAAAIAEAPAIKPIRVGVAKPEDAFSGDRLAYWAIWAVLFTLLSTFVVGGAIGGIIAALVAIPIGFAIPSREDGYKLPPVVSYLMILGSIGVFAWRLSQAGAGPI
ncbi:MAG TPA: hypothetical protein VFQ45_17185 [Longimicrobium sp.]|nr:hypothetical protein [Longimicrobium sp.]